MGPDSAPRIVSDLHEGRDEMYRIVPAKGRPFVVNKGHILTLQKTRERASVSNRKEQYGNPGDIVDVSVEEWLRWTPSKKHVFKLFRTGVDFPHREDFFLSPYFVGILLGDGSMSTTCQITTADSQILDAFTAEAEGLGLSVAEIKGKEGKAARTYSISSRKSRHKHNCVTDGLAALGLRGKICHNKFIPDEYKLGSRETRLQVLAGLIDTDGSLTRKGYDFISLSYRLSQDVAFIARSLGLAAYVKPCLKSCQTGAVGRYYRVSVSGKVDCIPCRVPRKIASPRLQLKSVLRTGFKVEPLGMGSYFGFSVNRDHRYLMGDFTVTHNSGKRLMALWLMKYAQERERKTLFVANRRLLVDQAWADAEKYGVSYGVIMANREQGDIGSTNQIASIHTLESWYFYDKDTGELDGTKLPNARLVQIDEAHQETKRYKKLLELYPDSKFVCFSATPVGSQGRSIVPDPFDHLIEPVKNSELIRDGFLLNTTVFAPSEPNIQGVGIDGGKEYNQSALGRAVREVTLFADIFKEWEAYQDQATVVFVPGIAYGRDIVNQFNHRLGSSFHSGKAAYLIEAKTPQKEREEIIARVASDGKGVLVSCDILREGFDCARLSVAIDLQPNSQLRTYWQKVGRIKRPYPGQSVATYLDFAGNYWRFPHPNEDPEWPIGGSLTTQDIIDRRRADKTDPQPIACPRCGLVRHSGSVCPGCGHASGDPVRRVRMGDGKLVEIPLENKKKRELTDAQRAYNEWKGCLYGALARGWTYGQCIFIYRKKTGEWPKDSWPGVCGRQSLELKRRPADDYTKAELTRLLIDRSPK